MMKTESHNTLTLPTSSSGLPTRAINIPYLILLLLLFGLSSYNLFQTHSFYTTLAIATFFIILMGGLIFFLKKSNQELALSVDDERIQCTESGGLSRTAYFSQLQSLKLTKSRIYVLYSGGHKEQFPLPAYSDDEFETLQNLLKDASEHHSFSFDVKKGWLYFFFDDA